MKQNYNIHKNPAQPSSEEIRAKADFSALLKEFEARGGKQATPPTSTPPVATRKIWIKYGLGALLAFTASIVLVFVFQQFYQTQPESPNTLAQQEWTDLDLTGLQKTWETPLVEAEIEAEQGGNLQGPKGSRVHIPAAAFQDANGQPIKGKVKVSYREIQYPAQVLLSKNPLGNNEEQYIQSLGLIYLSAEQNNQKLRLAQGQTLEISFNSVLAHLDKKQVQLLHLDPKNGTWEARPTEVETQVLASRIKTQALPAAMQANDQGQLQAQVENLDAQTLAQNFERELPKPKTPLKKVNDPSSVLQIDFKKDEFPELQRYGKVSWETDDDINPEWLEVVWDEAHIERDDQGQYRVHFASGERKINFKVQPVLPPNPQNEKAYQESLKAYELAILQRKQQIDSLVQQQLAANKPKRKLQSRVLEKVEHRFKIDELGLWNCGQILDAASLPHQELAFHDAQNKELRLERILIIYPQTQALYRRELLGGQSHAQIGLDAKQPLHVWAIGPNQQLYRLEKQEGSNWYFETQQVSDAAKVEALLLEWS